MKIQESNSRKSPSKRIAAPQYPTTLYIVSMQAIQKKHFFDPHDTARADSLAGVPLATLRQRLAAYIIDCLLIGLTYVPAMMALGYMFQTKMHGNEELYHSGKVAVRFNLEGLTTSPGSFGSFCTSASSAGQPTVSRLA